MKILQINNYAYLKGGSEKVFLDTISLLRQKGHEVRSFSVEDDKSKTAQDRTLVKISTWDSRKGFTSQLKGVADFIYNKRVEKELERLVMSFRPDVAHLHIYYGRLSNAVVRVLSRYGIPIVQTVHEYRLLCPAYTCLDNNYQTCELCAAEYFKYSCIRKKCLKSSRLLSIVGSIECFFRDLFFNNQRNFAAFIMVSKFIKEIHCKSFPEISSRCFQLYNSVDLSLYSKFRVTTKESYLLYVGRLSYEKGIFTLIEAMKDIPYDLKIAGTGPLFEKLQRKIKRENISNIELKGYVVGEELFHLIAHAKYVIIPSEWYENNPLSIIESFALGTPVIGSNIGGIPELVIDGRTGFISLPRNSVNLASVISSALRVTNEKYNVLVEECISFSKEHFSSENYYNALMDIYKFVTK